VTMKWSTYDGWTKYYLYGATNEDKRQEEERYDPRWYSMTTSRVLFTSVLRVNSDTIYDDICLSLCKRWRRVLRLVYHYRWYNDKALFGLQAEKKCTNFLPLNIRRKQKLTYAYGSAEVLLKCRRILQCYCPKGVQARRVRLRHNKGEMQEARRLPTSMSYTILSFTRPLIQLMACTYLLYTEFIYYTDHDLLRAVQVPVSTESFKTGDYWQSDKPKAVPKGLKT